MKITLINKTDSGGGAAIACRRLFEALQNSSAEASMLVQQKASSGAVIQSTIHNPFEKLQAEACFLYERLSFIPKERDKSVRFAFSTANAGMDIRQESAVIHADLLHLHWINGGFLSLHDLQKLLCLNKPVVWTLHDMWPFTGGCHYPGACDYFTTQCGNCYFLKKPFATDISRKGWLNKEKAYHGAKLTFIACSNWMREMALKSSLLQDFEIVTIPNPIDTNVFFSQDKALSRRKWGVPEQAKVILFGAANINHTRKGIKYLIEALHKIKANEFDASQQICVVIFGKSKGFDFEQIPFPVVNLPIIHSEAQLAEIYSLADVFVLPSLEDNLPNMVMEALSCSTPVVAFDTGGIRDMVMHGENGYLAKFMESDDLAAGIQTILSAANDSLSINARKKIIENFSYSIIAQRHVELYERLLQ